MGLAVAYSVNASLVPREKPSWAQTSTGGWGWGGAHLACTDSEPAWGLCRGPHLWEEGGCLGLGNTWAAGLPSQPAGLSRFSCPCPGVWAGPGHTQPRAPTLAPSSSRCRFRCQLHPESCSCPQASSSDWSERPSSICGQKGCLSPRGPTPWT